MIPNMAAKKENDFEFLRETFGRKYFLVKKDDKSYFVFRTPGAFEGEKLKYELANWVGEVVPWGLVPAKVRKWLSDMHIKPHEGDQKTLQQS